MPELDGRQLADELRGRRPDLKVLFVSGYASEIIAERGVLDPGIELLEKPFLSAELLRRVRELLSSGVVLTPEAD